MLYCYSFLAGVLEKFLMNHLNIHHPAEIFAVATASKQW